MKKLMFLAFASVFLVACGGSGSGNNNLSTPPPTAVGVFLDSAVEGLQYETTSGVTGTTSPSGIYNYRDGDSATFTLAGLILGSSQATATIFPSDIAISATATGKIAQLLQSLDSDGNATNGIDISAVSTASINAVLTTLSNLLTDDSVEGFTLNNIQSLITGNATFTTRESAIQHLNTTIADANTGAFDYGISIDNAGDVRIKHTLLNNEDDTTIEIGREGKGNNTVMIDGATITAIETNITINIISDLATNTNEVNSSLRLEFLDSDQSSPNPSVEYRINIEVEEVDDDFFDANSDKFNRASLRASIEDYAIDIDVASPILLGSSISTKLSYEENNSGETEIIVTINGVSQTFSNLISTAGQQSKFLGLGTLANTYYLHEVGFGSNISNASPTVAIDTTFSNIKLNSNTITNDNGLNSAWNEIEKRDNMEYVSF